MDLNYVFRPKTLAVVGVSTKNLFNPGTVILRKNRFMRPHGAGVYGVNPRGGVIEGMPLFAKLEDIPERLDLVVSAVRAKDTIGVMEEACELGTRALIVVSGGFAEVGNRDLQDRLVRIVEKHDVACVGPNCVGVFNPPHVDTFFIPSERFVRPKMGGNTALVSQSGGILADQFFAKFAQWDVPISAAVSVGNKACVGEIELLEYFTRDPQTKNIALYVEDFKDGRRFLEVTTRTNKTVIVYRGGRTEYGSAAVQSHTAAVASSPLLTSCALKQYGVVEVRNEQELVNFAKIFTVMAKDEKPFLPRVVRGDLVVLSVSGGHGVLASDLVKEYGMRLVRFTEEEKQALKELVNPSAAAIASYNNPIDLTGSVVDDDIVRTTEALLQMDKVEGLILLILPYPPLISMHLGNRIQSLVRIHRKPVVAYVPRLARYGMILEALEEGNVPCADSIEQAVEMMYAVHLRSLGLRRREKNLLVDAGLSDEYYAL
ncbi:MAG: CoA-binding protein [Promethearchaeota archaeon]